jgi:hypothetical protein
MWSARDAHLPGETIFSKNFSGFSSLCLCVFVVQLRFLGSSGIRRNGARTYAKIDRRLLAGDGRRALTH